MTTKIQVRDAVKQWLIATRCDGQDCALKFHEGEDIYHIILDVMSKRRAEDPCVDRGNLEIVLPNPRVGKDSRVYNYIGERGTAIIAQKLTHMFRIHWRSEVAEMETLGTHVRCAATRYICRYALDGLLSEDAIIKDYYRWRKKFTRKKQLT